MVVLGCIRESVAKPNRARKEAVALPVVQTPVRTKHLDCHSILDAPAVGWGLLGLACALVPHTWQQRRKRGGGGSRSWAYTWKYGGVRRRERLRRKLMELQPMTWLVCREHWQSLGLWAAALCAGGLAIFDHPEYIGMGMGLRDPGAGHSAGGHTAIVIG